MGLWDQTDNGVRTPPIPPELAESLGPVFAELAEERARQDAKWGGPEHDDAHNQYDWLGFVADRIGMIRPGDATPEGIADYRKKLVQAGALCVAAIQSCDRNLARAGG